MMNTDEPAAGTLVDGARSRPGRGRAHARKGSWVGAALSAIVGAACASPGLAECPTSMGIQTSATCSGPERRALDFWLGEWTVSWSLADGRSGKATNTVTAEMDGCVVREHFRDLAGGLEGVGVYSYFVPIKSWTQTWMDNQGTTIQSTGGPAAHGAERFELLLRRGPDPNRTYRFVFFDVTDTSLVWKYQSRASADEQWADEAVSFYARAR